MGQKNVSSIIIEITVFQGLNCMQETVIIIGERKGHLNRGVLILSGVSLIWFHCTAIIPYLAVALLCRWWGVLARCRQAAVRVWLSKLLCKLLTQTAYGGVVSVTTCHLI